MKEANLAQIYRWLRGSDAFTEYADEFMENTATEKKDILLNIKSQIQGEIDHVIQGAEEYDDSTFPVNEFEEEGDYGTRVFFKISKMPSEKSLLRLSEYIYEYMKDYLEEQVEREE